METTDKKYKIVPYKKEVENWIKIFNPLFEYIETSTTFKIYCYLCYKYDEELDCSNPSIETISLDCKIGATTVKRAIKELEKLKLIKKNKTKTSNKYQLFYLTEDLDVDGEMIVIKKVSEIARYKTRKSNREYEKWRISVLERDDYTCQLCGCRDDNVILNVHHIEKYSENELLRADIDNGITLCYKCHGKIFGKEKDFEEYFKMLIRRD